jgi:protein ImuA
VEQQPGPIMLVHPPFQPFGPALRGQGLASELLLCVQAPKTAARLWATEQALRCADLTAVLAWLPQARSEDLRRLHLCAQQHDKLLVVFRGIECRGQSSPARVRLLVEGVDRMEVRILKRRGPPLLQPLVLRAQPARLAALLAARKGRKANTGVTAPAAEGASHGMDRTAALA